MKIIKKEDIIIHFDIILASYCQEIKLLDKKRQRKHGKRLENYDKVIAISDEMKKETEEMYPFLKEKLFRLYNFFNFSEIKYKSCENTVEKKLKEEYIISVGRFKKLNQ